MKFKFNCRINFTKGNNNTQTKKNSISRYTPTIFFLHLFPIVTFTSFTASFPTSLLGRIFKRVASTQPVFASSPPTVPSDSSPHSHCLPTSALVFLYFSSPPHPSSSLSPHILHFFSWISVPLYPYFLLLLLYFSHFLCPSKYSIPYSVHLCNTTRTSQHPHFYHVQFLLLRFLHCPCPCPVNHCHSYNSRVLLSCPCPVNHCRSYNSRVLLSLGPSPWFCGHEQPLTPLSNFPILTVLYWLSQHQRSPSSATVDPRYVNAITPFHLSPCCLFVWILASIEPKVFSLLSADFHPPASVARIYSSIQMSVRVPLFWWYTTWSHWQLACTTGIYILYRRPITSVIITDMKGLRDDLLVSCQLYMYCF